MRQLDYRPPDKPSTRRSSPPRHPSFKDFLRSAAYRSSKRCVIDEAANRMLAANIGSLPQLLRFVRENFPEEYRRFHYRHEVTGQEATERLWADYLRWCHWRELFGEAVA